MQCPALARSGEEFAHHDHVFILAHHVVRERFEADGNEASFDRSLESPEIAGARFGQQKKGPPSFELRAHRFQQRLTNPFPSASLAHHQAREFGHTIIVTWQTDVRGRSQTTYQFPRALGDEPAEFAGRQTVGEPGTVHVLGEWIATPGRQPWSSRIRLSVQRRHGLRVRDGCQGDVPLTRTVSAHWPVDFFSAQIVAHWPRCESITDVMMKPDAASSCCTSSTVNRLPRRPGSSARLAFLTLSQCSRSSSREGCAATKSSTKPRRGCSWKSRFVSVATITPPGRTTRMISRRAWRACCMANNASSTFAPSNAASGQVLSDCASCCAISMVPCRPAWIFLRSCASIPAETSTAVTRTPRVASWTATLPVPAPTSMTLRMPGLVNAATWRLTASW